MSRESLIVLLLSIPVSLATGLLVRPIQSAIDRGKKGWQSRQAQRRKADYVSLLNYVLYPERLTNDLIFASLQTTQALWQLVSGFAMTTLILVAVIPESVSTASHNPAGGTRVILWIMAILGSTFSSLGSYHLNKTSSEMSLLKSRLAAFDSFIKTFPEEIREPDLEKLALATRKHGRPMWTAPPDE